jgi:hypothetical protein
VLEVCQNIIHEEGRRYPDTDGLLSDTIVGIWSDVELRYRRGEIDEGVIQL